MLCCIISHCEHRIKFGVTLKQQKIFRLENRISQILGRRLNYLVARKMRGHNYVLCRTWGEFEDWDNPRGRLKNETTPIHGDMQSHCATPLEYFTLKQGLIKLAYSTENAGNSVNLQTISCNSLILSSWRVRILFVHYSFYTSQYMKIGK